jgi:hypothetical protein
MDWRSIGADGQAPLDLGSIALLTIGQHTLTLDVRDGITTVTDDVILTIQNSAPTSAPTGGGTYELGSTITLGGQVSDFDGDTVTYQWLEGSTVWASGLISTIEGGTPVTLPPYTPSGLTLGSHQLSLSVSDGVNQPVVRTVTVKIIDTQAPKLAPVPDKTILWPPNHQMVPVTIAANATDVGGLPASLAALVTSNEPEEGLGDGDAAPDWIIQEVSATTGKIVLQLRAERSGAGNGREYSVLITATDSSGNTGAAIVKILVPHDKRAK